MCVVSNEYQIKVNLVLYGFEQTSSQSILKWFTFVHDITQMKNRHSLKQIENNKKFIKVHTFDPIWFPH